MNVMKNILIVLLIVVLLIGAVLLYGFLKGGDRDLGQAPDLTVHTVAGEDITLSTFYKESGAVLVFFDRKNEQSVKLLQNLSAADGTPVLLVSLDDTEKELSAFLSENNIAFPAAADDGAAAETYHISAGPVSYFIRKDGSVRAVSLSNMNEKTIRKYLKYIKNS